MRCIITGLPVTPEVVLHKVNDRLPCSPPLQLHTREVTHDGSRTFTRNATRAMHDWSEPRRTLTYEETHWWTLPGAEQELYANFPRDLVDIILLIRRDGTPVEYAISGSRYDLQTVNGGMRLMRDHIRAVFLTAA